MLIAGGLHAVAVSAPANDVRRCITVVVVAVAADTFVVNSIFSCSYCYYNYMFSIPSPTTLPSIRRNIFEIPHCSQVQKLLGFVCRGWQQREMSKRKKGKQRMSNYIQMCHMHRPHTLTHPHSQA